VYENHKTDSNNVGHSKDAGQNVTGENQTNHHREHIDKQRRIQTRDEHTDVTHENLDDNRKEPEE